MSDPVSKKILLIISSLHVGGAQRVMVILANAWAKRGVAVEILVLSSEHMSQYLVDERVKINFLPLQAKSGNAVAGVFNNLKRLFEIRYQLKKSQAQNVISFIDRTNVLVVLSALGSKKRIIISERSDPRSHSIGLGWHFARKLFYRFADALVVQTKSVKMWAEDYISTKKIFVISNPVPKLPDLTSPPMVAKNIYCVARLVSGKGHAALIEAFYESMLHMQGWKLLLIGDGPLEHILRRQTELVELTESVVFLGRVSDPTALLQTGEIFVLNSDNEGFPNSLVEAMGMGMAVISSDCMSGPGEIITHGKDGFLFPVGDKGKLISYLIMLAGDESLRRKLGQEAVKVRERFEENHILQLWTDVLDSIREN